jgi:hypothetical protein
VEPELGRAFRYGPATAEYPHPTILVGKECAAELSKQISKQKADLRQLDPDPKMAIRRANDSTAAHVVTLWDGAKIGAARPETVAQSSEVYRKYWKCADREAVAQRHYDWKKYGLCANRFLLQGRPQIGKTGAFLHLIKLLFDSVHGTSGPKFLPLVPRPVPDPDLPPDASKGTGDLVMTDAGDSGPALVASESELRVTLGENTKPDLIEKCRAAGISGYSNKRKEELIELLVVKKPRLPPSNEVQYAGAPNKSGATGLRDLRLAFCFLSFHLVFSTGTLVQVRPLAPLAAAQPVAAAAVPVPVAKQESTEKEEASVRVCFFAIRAVYPLYGSWRACVLLGVTTMIPTGCLDKR